MKKTRLEAFSDGVLAIIITIMVLEMKIPHQPDLHSLLHLWPVFLSYLLSFVFVGIYWGNHHHLLHTVHHVNSGIIWSNLALLFALSLIPFSTGWMGENHFERIPVALYGVNMLFCALCYQVLQFTIMKHYVHPTRLSDALKKQKAKGTISLLLYISSIPIAFYIPALSALLIVTVAIMWIIPDKNIEDAIREMKEEL
jgi:uncharacterized membrane protein